MSWCPEDGPFTRLTSLLVLFKVQIHHYVCSLLNYQPSSHPAGQLELIIPTALCIRRESQQTEFNLTDFEDVLIWWQCWCKSALCLLWLVSSQSALSLRASRPISHLVLLPSSSLRANKSWLCDKNLNTFSSDTLAQARPPPRGNQTGIICLHGCSL